MAIRTTISPAEYEEGAAVSPEEFERLSLDDPTIKWELHRGRLREKPGMGWEHSDIAFELGFLLRQQLDRNEFRIHIEGGRLRRATRNYYIPDLIVIPLAYGQGLRGLPVRLEVYTDPLPLVVEVWSPSTGTYDVRSKLPEYQQRGDLEIWYIHPFNRTLTAWCRQPDGTYTETVYTGGIVSPVALPNVGLDLDALFAP